MSWLGVHILGEVYNGSWGVSDSALRQKNWTRQFLTLCLYRRVWFVLQLWLCKQGSVRVKSAFLQGSCVPVSQLSDTQIQDHFISSGIHTASKHSQGQVVVFFQFYCKNHFPRSQKGPELTHVSKKWSPGKKCSGNTFFLIQKPHTWYYAISIYEIMKYGRGGCCPGLPS